MDWTKEQREAIDRNGNVLVSAAAGAGKTAVLAERVVRLVGEGTGVEQLLVLTFTRAAAAEMKARIARRLSDCALKADVPERRSYFRAQAEAVASASISTIHSFCARVIRRHFDRAELPPATRTMDETESARLRSEVLDAQLTELAKEAPERYRLPIRAFGSERNLIVNINALLATLAGQPDPKRYLDECLEPLSSPAAFAALVERYLAFSREELQAAIEAMTFAKEGLSPDYGKVIAQLDGELMQARGCLLAEGADAYGTALAVLGDSFERLLFPRGTDESVKRPVTMARDALKKFVRAQADELRCGEDALFLRQSRSAEPTCALVELTRDFLTRYEAEKRSRALMDFNDLEHLALTCLADEKVAEEYRRRYACIIVDEYQDSNRVQEAILQHIARSGGLFYVGDVKQSIYRFRMAEPSLFLDKLNSFTGDKGSVIRLKDNFRSSKEVLDAVNLVFRRLMTERTGPIHYDEEALQAGIVQPKGAVELDLIERRVQSDAPEDTPDDAEAEALACAAEIHALLRQSPNEEDKPLRYCDFAILLHTTTAARSFAQTLSKQGIPCYAQLTGGYFEAIEVMLTLNYLRVMDNRRQDIPLLSVLRSCLGGFTDEDLIALRQKRRDGEWIDCLTAACEDDDALGLKCRDFLDTLERRRRDSLRRPVEEFLADLFDESGLEDELSALAGGAQRAANLEALLAQARSFDGTGGFSVHGFLRYMEEAEKNASLGAAQTAGSDVVRIMSIHRSKGLEFPVVFLCRLGAAFNREDTRRAFVTHPTLGLGLKYLDEAGRKCDTLPHKLIIKTVDREQQQERMRLLYVGMTRAVRRLYLIGSVSDAEKRLLEADPASSTELLSASSYLKWLLPPLKGHIPVRILFREDLQASPPAVPPADDTANEQIKNALLARFAWRYPFSGAVGVPSKSSVTELSDKPQQEFAVPDFLLESSRNVLTLGTQAHAILERLPLRPPAAGELGALANRLGLDEPSILSSLEWFTDTPLFAALCHADEAHREWPFSYLADSERLGLPPSEERVLLQGVIDACYRTETGWVLIDYKTDYIGNTQPLLWAQRHDKQLRLYAEVLTALTGLPVQKRLLVLLRAQAIVDMDEAKEAWTL